MSELHKTPLFAWHNAHSDIVDFAGWAMPVRYSNINKEHKAVRNAVGIFDTSHMGRIWVRGKDCRVFIDKLVPRDMSLLKDNQCAYTYMLNENGGFRDDVIVTRFTDDTWFIVNNAGNRQKIWDWVNLHAKDFDVELEQASDDSSMIAVQGPTARDLLSKLSGSELPGRFKAMWITIKDKKLLLTTTGYTGEAGGEIILFEKDKDKLVKDTEMIWETLIEAGAEPCALGSRDILRLEAGLSLYGNDMDETTHVLESSICFVPFAHIDKNVDYIGKEAIFAKKGKEEKFRVFFKMLKRGVPRHGYTVYVDGKEAGVVTSGSMSPLTKEFFGMAYVPYALKEIGSQFEVDINGKRLPAEVILLPLYDTDKYGYYRKQ